MITEEQGGLKKLQNSQPLRVLMEKGSSIRSLFEFVRTGNSNKLAETLKTLGLTEGQLKNLNFRGESILHEASRPIADPKMLESVWKLGLVEDVGH